MRRAQGFLQLVEALMVVFAFQVPLDSLQYLFNFLQSGVQAGDLVLTGKLLEELDLSVLALGALVSELTNDAIGSLVDALDSVTQVDELLRNRARID